MSAEQVIRDCLMQFQGENGLSRGAVAIMTNLILVGLRTEDLLKEEQ